MLPIKYFKHNIFLYFLLVKDEPIVENLKSVHEGLKSKAPIVSLPPSPPLLRRPRPPNDAPIKMPSQPVLGLSRVPPLRYRVSNNKL